MIDKDTATEIANAFFSSMNPTFWDGEGERPSGFDRENSHASPLL